MIDKSLSHNGCRIFVINFCFCYSLHYKCNYGGKDTKKKQIKRFFGKKSSFLVIMAPKIEKSAPKLGEDIPTSEKRALDWGEEIPNPEKRAADLGHKIPTPENLALDWGEDSPTCA
jgi:hypothetical protein